MIVSHVKRLMEEKGITILALANQFKIADRTIKRARGPLIRDCKLSTLEKIAQALNVSLTDLFTVQ